MFENNDALFSTEKKKDERYYGNALVLDASIELEKALKRVELTQKALAEKMGATESYVSQVLGGGKNITLKTLARFAFNLGFMLRLELCPLDDMNRRTDKQRSLWDAEASAPKAKALDKFNRPKVFPIPAHIAA